MSVTVSFDFVPPILFETAHDIIHCLIGTLYHIRKLYEDNVSGRITDERFDYLSKSYEDEQKELQLKIQELKEILAVVDNDNENLAKFIRIVRQYTEIEELTPDILHCFVDRIYIGETEVYEGQKFQDVKIVYNLVGAIDLPQYAI